MRNTNTINSVYPQEIMMASVEREGRMASRLKRKNLMINPEQLHELARRRGTSESAAVRQLVDFALAADEALDALRELRERGGVDDVFGRLPSTNSN